MAENALRNAVSIAVESMLLGATNPCESLSRAKIEVEAMMTKVGDDAAHLALLKLVHEEIKARLKVC